VFAGHGPFIFIETRDGISYNRAMTLLGSKLIRPASGNTLDRDRLVRPLVAPHVKLIQIIAGAGFGKTTLAAQVLEASDALPVWYRLDGFDRDFSLFMTYLTKALEDVLSGADLNFPQPPSPSMPPPNRWPWLLKWMAALDAGLSGPVIMVLDDYHLVDEGINRVVEFILERMPREMALILISRKEPGLKVSRLRASRQVMDIHEGDLAFNGQETRNFFSRISHGENRDLDEADLGVIQSKTRGWAAGLVLFSCAMKQDPFQKIGKDLGRLPGSRTHVFNYLEENIFEFQAPERKAFMVKTALLDIMDTDLCDQVLGIQDSGRIFREMMADHLMVFPVDGDETGFYYHHLLRDFLRAKADGLLGRDEVCQIHLAAAGILAESQHPLALQHYIEAGDYETAAGMLEALEVQFLLKGKMPFVKECLDRIPARERESHPQILFMEAKQYSYYGRPDKAIESLKTARGIFMERGEPDQAIKCLADLGAQYYYTGCIPEAKGLMEQVLEDIRPESPTYILVMTYLIFFTGVLGEIGLSKSYENRARDEVDLYPEFERRAALILINTSVTYRHYITGELKASSRLNDWLIREIGQTQLAACLPLACYQSAAADYYLGRYEQGLAHAREGIRAAEKIHLRDSQKGWIYLAWAENCMGLGQWNEAEKLARQGLEIFEGPGNRWGQANALNLLARLYIKQHRLSEAGDFVDKALGAIKDRGIDFPRSIIKLTRARLLVFQREYRKALDLLVSLERPLARAIHYQSLAGLLAVKCRMALGEAEHGADGLQLNRIREAGQKSGWDKWVEGCVRLPGITEKKSVPGLTLNLMGPFQLSVGDREIHRDDWSHAKSLLLFKYLAAHRDKGYLPKELLVEVMWPEQDFSRTGKRFNVATSRLRKILEPHLPPRSRSAYILRRRDQYRLSLGPGGESDLDTFLAHARAARLKEKTDPGAGERHCLAAVASYGGPFLEDTLYEDWCIRKREELALEYYRILKQLIRHCRDREDAGGILKWTQACLEEDPFDEAMYQSLMSLFAHRGQYDRVIRCFERCNMQMEKIDCPVSTKTRNLFRDIMSRQSP